MCSIAGILSTGPHKVNREFLTIVSESMKHRGPDGSGMWLNLDQSIGLAHQRLSIIDLSPVSNQPMSDLKNELKIVFNGEIYNYKKLRSELESKGYQFNTQSDTEVILNLYKEYKESLFQYLEGMYAFGIWDIKNDSLLIGRDAYGIKPLYYTEKDLDGNFAFASEVKALVKITTKAKDSAGQVGYMLLGSVPEPFTSYEKIKSLPAGSFANVTKTGEVQIKYHSKIEDIYRAIDCNTDISTDYAISCIESEIDLSIKKHIVADVPVGIFLSAGLDSNLIALIASKYCNYPITAITIGFEDNPQSINEEIELSKLTAQQLGLNHVVHIVSKTEFKEHFPKILKSMDQPSIDGVNTYFASMVAAKSGLKVVLSGVGGDELLFGYPSFNQIPTLLRYGWVLKKVFFLGTCIRKIGFFIFGNSINQKYFGLIEYSGSLSGCYFLRRAVHMPWELSTILGNSVAKVGIKNLSLIDRLNLIHNGIKSSRLAISALESCIYLRNQLLRDADWAGMANSVEIRTPFVDFKLLTGIAPYLGAVHHLNKTQIMQGMLKGISNQIISKPKTGFATPVNAWQYADKRRVSGIRGWAIKIYKAQIGND